MAEYIEFKAPEIGMNRTKKILPTNKIVRKVLTLELTQAKVMAMKDNPETVDEVEEYVNGTLKFMDETEDFLTTTLGLNKKQQEALEELTQEQLGELSGRLQVTLLHVDQSVSDTDEEDEPDPK
ncbi:MULTISPECIES: phage tail tube assembly chaperone [unclassified Levilactobacillus]|uniref:phage tail tube assembly chaperone n=1 Tax=unclassified Levilactobacillus TaxID=2767918 RepID=UPI002FEF102D